jgi:site-specific recombinase XerD
VSGELVKPADSLAVAQTAAAGFILASKAANTTKAYASDWRDFEGWCTAHGKTALPAEPADVAAYLASLTARGLRTATIRRRCAAIGHHHQRANHDSPCSHAGVKAVLSGIARQLGTAKRKKAALTADLVVKAVRRIPSDDLAGLRDRALLLVGFAAALRRSELVDLNVNDVGRHPKGITLTLRKSKTDQQGEGTIKAVPHGKKLGAVAALDAWMAAAKIIEGPVFRGVRGACVLAARLCDRQVARIVKKRCAMIGLDAGAFAAHSLRSGFITSADAAGETLAKIGKHVGHKKADTTLGYVQVGDAFRDHAGKKFL